MPLVNSVKFKVPVFTLKACSKLLRKFPTTLFASCNSDYKTRLNPFPKLASDKLFFKVSDN